MNQIITQIVINCMIQKKKTITEIFIFIPSIQQGGKTLRPLLEFNFFSLETLHFN